MGKRKVKDSEIINQHLNGLNYTQIGENLKLTRQTVSKVVKKHLEDNNQLTKQPTNQPISLDDMRTIIKLEITQENTLTELSEQMKDYTDNYERAVKNEDEKSAYAWSQNRLKIIDMMAKITGLYNAPVGSSDNKLIIEVEFVGD